MNCKIPFLSQKENKNDFRSSFVDRIMKPPIIMKNTDTWLTELPFKTATHISGVPPEAAALRNHGRHEND